MFESVDGRTDGRTDARTPARVPSYKFTFGSGELKKDNKQCLSDTPRWSMKKTNIKNT